MVGRMLLGKRFQLSAELTEKKSILGCVVFLFFSQPLL
jgi:hypothetical protein